MLVLPAVCREKEKRLEKIILETARIKNHSGIAMQGSEQCYGMESKRGKKYYIKAA
ncbi:MAG: hypothetical protein RR685_02515 [Hungatella sp.]